MNNGYNLTEGGKGAKKSKEACMRIKEAKAKAKMNKTAFVEKMQINTTRIVKNNVQNSTDDKPKNDLSLPPNIFYVKNDQNKVIGYKAEGEGIPVKEFTDSYINSQNLDRAKRYIQLIALGPEYQGKRIRIK